MTLYVKLLGVSAPEAFGEMTELLEEVGAQISLTDENSVLSYFNEKAEAGEKVEISEETHGIISLALAFEEETFGAFSIGAYNLSRLWGLDADGYSGYDPFEGVPVAGDLPDYGTEVSVVKEHCDTSALTLSEDGNRFYIEKSDKELKIDLGGIAKGYLADKCVEIMKKHSLKSGLVNISGNIALYGGYYNGRKFEDWEIAVLNPRPKVTLYREEICLLSTGGDVSAVTSGDYRRYYRHESGLELCHIIDPRSGLPIDITLGSDGKSYEKKSEVISSATVMCASSAAADAYSTALCVMGAEKAAEFIKEKQAVDALFFTEKQSGGEEIRGRMFASGGVEFIETDVFGEFRRYERSW